MQAMLPLASLRPHGLDPVLDAITASEDRIRRDIVGLRSDLTKVLDSGDWQLPDDGVAFQSSVQTAPSAASGDKFNPDKFTLNIGQSAQSPGSMGNLQSGGSKSTLTQDSPSLVLERPSLQVPKSSKRSVCSMVTGQNDPERDKRVAGSITGMHVRAWKGWPSNIKIHPDFAVDDNTPDSLGGLKNLAQMAVDRAEKLVQPSGMFEAATPKRVFSMIRPDSERRLAFDVICLTVLMFDVVYTPYSLTWEGVIPDVVAIPLLSTTTSFWVLDLLLSFCTGFYTAEGRVELRFRSVAVQYLRTWFFPDFACVAADLVNLFPIVILGQKASSGRTGTLSRVIRISKLARFLRVLGMVRMLRVINAVNMYMEAELSEAWKMMVRILQLSACLLWLGHLCACGWFAVGTGAPRGEMDEDWTETEVGLLTRRRLDDLGPGYQYVTSYGYGLAQLTLGAHDIDPINTSERLFTICCNLFGLLFGGTLISILSTTLIDLREINQEKATKMRTLKEFLLQHQVEMGVRLRILRQVQERVKHRDHVLVEKDVHALQVLSHTLRREMRYCLFMPHLLTHTVFRAWTCISDETLRSLCGEEGVEFLFLLPDDQLFSVGKVAIGAYNIMSGTIEYKAELQGIGVHTGSNSNNILREDSVQGSDRPYEEVEKGAWLCEAAWWCEWFHVGTATARDPSTFLSVPSRVLFEAMGTNLSVHAITVEYARLFHERITHVADRMLPTDIHVHHAGFSDLIFSMSSDIHTILGMAALEQAVTTNRHWKLETRSVLLKMEEEIRDGQSIVLLDKDGFLQRQVALALLSLERETPQTDEVLTEIAVYDGLDWQPTCRLPGTKTRFGETPGQSLQRFLDDRLMSCRDFLRGASFWAFNTTEEIHMSAQFGIGTTYNKSTFSVPCDEEALAKLSRFALPVDQIIQYKSSSAPRIDKNPSRRRLPSLEIANQKEELLRLEDIREVYCMGGREQVGMYIWMEREAREALAQAKDVLHYWTKHLAQSIPKEKLTGEWWALPEKITLYEGACGLEEITSSETSSI